MMTGIIGVSKDEQKGYSTALTKALKEEPNRVENILGKNGLAGATEKKVDFAKTQRDKIFPSAQQMLGPNYQRALAYTSAGALTSMNAYANVGTLLIGGLSRNACLSFCMRHIPIFAKSL